MNASTIIVVEGVIFEFRSVVNLRNCLYWDFRNISVAKCLLI